MRYTIEIKNRLNWIDWAKAIAISLVVFGHIPMSPDNFIQKFITNYHMPLFFLISGYLTKKECFNINTIRKYWHTLIIPYIFYNLIFYPYWIVRHNVDVPNAVISDYIKPIIGIFFLQLHTPISSPLNEVTWFVAVLLIMKLVLSITYLYKNGDLFLILLSLICALLYIYNQQNMVFTNLPITGLIRCMPFFIIGHFCKRKNIIPLEPNKYDYFVCAIGITGSFFSYEYLLHYTPTITIYALFYLCAFVTVIGTISLCRIFDKTRSTIIENISLGTIVIMGLHWMLIGSTNYVLQKLLGLSHGITYPLFITIVLTIFFDSIIYPIIILFKNKYPFLLGKDIKKNQHNPLQN